MSIKARVKNTEQFAKFMNAALDMFEEKGAVNMTCNDLRSIDANATIRLCYKQIQQMSEGMTAKDVERQCKLNYGVPILRRDCEIQDYVFGDLERRYGYERMLKIMDMFAVTSTMNTKQCGEMIEQMLLDHSYIVIKENN